jgi:hypothetical protein
MQDDRVNLTRFDIGVGKNRIAELYYAYYTHTGDTTYLARSLMWVGDSTYGLCLPQPFLRLSRP